jgi:hypothetical protein
MTPSDHEDLQALLGEASLEILRPTERRRLMAHARECEVCAEALAGYQAVVGTLALLAPAAEWPESRRLALRRRLLARVEGESRPEHPRLVAWLGWVVAAGLAGIVLVHHSIHRPVDFGWLAAGVLALSLVATGAYAAFQRRRVAELRGRLERVEGRETPPANSEVP